MVTKKRCFLEALMVFAAILTWRILVLWRGKINQALWQDEMSWNNSARSKTLLENVFLPDSGYPVPVYRLIIWVIAHLFPQGIGLIHIFSAVIAAGSCSSMLIILRHHFYSQSLRVLALIIGFFPTFDLLLFHNIAYFFFIPTISFLLIRILERKFSLFDGVFFSFLIGFCTKPQLLLSILVGLLLHLLLLRAQLLRSFASLSLPIITVLILVILGRIGNNQLDLIWSLRNVCQSLVAILYIPSAILLPAISIGLTGFARMQNNTMLSAASIIGLVLVNFIFLSRIISVGRPRIRRALNANNTQNSITILLFLAPIYMSMFLFPNSGWENKFFWENFCTLCTYQRHWLPVMFLSILAIIVSIPKSKLFTILLEGTLFQISIIAIFAYPYLYFPT